MKTLMQLRPAAWAGVLAVAIAGQAALAGPLIYVPMGALDEILVIDTATDKIVDRISDIPVVHGLAKTPDGQYLIAGSFEEREAGDPAPMKPAGISEKDHKAHHAAAPAGAANASPVVSTVSVIRIADKSVVRSIDVPGAVHHVAVGPKGRYAVVTLTQKGAISAIDLASFKVVATVATGPMPNYAVFSPDGSQVYVSNAGNDTVTQVDTASWGIQWSARVGAKPEHIVISRDGAALFVNNIADGTVSVVSPKERKVVKTISVGSKLHGIDLSDDGKTLFVAARGQNKVVSVDLATGATRARVLAPAPYHLAVIRGTGKIYVTSADEPVMWAIEQNSAADAAKIAIGGRGHQIVQGTGG